jgi:hypothetical protein
MIFIAFSFADKHRRRQESIFDERTKDFLIENLAL